MRSQSILHTLIRTSISATCIIVYSLGSAHAGLVCEETVYNSNLVRAVQTKLREAKVQHVSANGKWDKETEKRISAYQKLNKLPTNGTLDEDTFRAMFGKERSYEPISKLVRNPHHAPEDLYEQYCRH